MRNPELAIDYVRRASTRLKAPDVYVTAESWADVVRESQEAVELALKGLLRACEVQPPRIHDVSDILLAERERLPATLSDAVDELVTISRRLRRDRELAFDGAQDLTPSRFYSRADAEKARNGARRVMELVSPHVLEQE